MRNYDVFISYRREGGDQAAKAIHDNLRERGYRVFLDVEALRSGAFNTKLYSVLDACRDVVVVLAPGSLERCWHEDDWLRLEVTHALRAGKNVIPVMLRGFVFPEQLPEDMEPLRMQNGVAASVEFFDAFLDKLCSFLKSKGGFFARKTKRPVLRVLTLMLAGMLGLGAAGAAVAARAGMFDYPMTAAQREDVDSLLNVVRTNYTLADGMLYEADTVLADCEAYLREASDLSWLMVEEQLRQCRERLADYQNQVVALPDPLVEALSQKGLDETELTHLDDAMLQLNASALEMVDTLSLALDPESLVAAGTRTRLVELYHEDMALSADQLFTGFCQLTLPVREQHLLSFKQAFLPSLRFCATRLDLWSRDKGELEMAEAAYATRFSSLMEKPERMLLMEERTSQLQRSALIDMLVMSGRTDAEAETLVNALLEGSSDGIEGEFGPIPAGGDEEMLAVFVEEARAEMREKFAPREDDDPYIVWAKALRFLRVSMPEEAMAAFAFHREQMLGKDAFVSDYVAAAIRFVAQQAQTGVISGVLVSGYEPGKPIHTVFRPGDIIIAVDGAPCRGYDEFEALRTHAGAEYQVTVLRADDTGMLKREELVIPEGQPRVALMELSEAEMS